MRKDRISSNDSSVVMSDSSTKNTHKLKSSNNPKFVKLSSFGKK